MSAAAAAQKARVAFARAVTQHRPELATAERLTVLFLAALEGGELSAWADLADALDKLEGGGGRALAGALRRAAGVAALELLRESVAGATRAGVARVAALGYPLEVAAEVVS